MRYLFLLGAAGFLIPVVGNLFSGDDSTSVAYGALSMGSLILFVLLNILGRIQALEEANNE